MVVDRIEDIFDYFSLDYKKGKKFYYGKCPIHDGDNGSAWQFYQDGAFFRGNWICRTHGCQNTFKRTSIGCVRGLLSRFDFGWKTGGDKTASFKDTTDWLFRFLKTNGKDLSVNKPQVEKRQFINSVGWTSIKQKENSLYIPRATYRNTPTLTFSSAYLESRGFSEDILRSYDIAECLASGKEMTGRVVLPIFNDKYSHITGVTGRSLYTKCDSCKAYHAGDCPAEGYRWQYTKWRHNKDFCAEDQLFNYWRAKEHIDRLHSVVLVESPLSVLRLEQAGVYNSLATFGAHLTDAQLNKLFATSLYTVNLIPDNDPAGLTSAEEIRTRINRIFNTNVIVPELNDVADMSVEDIKTNLVGKIRNH